MQVNLNEKGNPKGAHYSYTIPGYRGSIYVPKSLVANPPTSFEIVGVEFVAVVRKPKAEQTPEEKAAAKAAAAEARKNETPAQKAARAQAAAEKAAARAAKLAALAAANEAAAAQEAPAAE